MELDFINVTAPVYCLFPWTRAELAEIHCLSTRFIMDMHSISQQECTYYKTYKTYSLEKHTVCWQKTHFV